MNGHESGEQAKLFGGTETMSKVEMYNWTLVDNPGVYAEIDKSLLNVDPTYQRERIAKARVNRIASAWSWVACCVLVVARRPDGSCWVVDGQHRKLAADKRSDISYLPCLVFEVHEIRDEATGFLRVNADRGPLRTTEKFKSLVGCEDPVAVAVNEMVENTGHHVDDHGTRGSVKCVGALMAFYKRDSELTKNIWGLALQMCNGSPPWGDLIKALFVMERRLRDTGSASIFQSHNRKSLIALEPERMKKKMADLRIALGRGGERVYAEALTMLVNYGRRSRRLPSMYQ